MKHKELAHVLVAQVENKEVDISLFVLAFVPSVLRLGGIGLMMIEKQLDSCKWFYVFKVSRRMKLNVTFSIKGRGNGEL